MNIYDNRMIENLLAAEEARMRAEVRREGILRQQDRKPAPAKPTSKAVSQPKTGSLEWAVAQADSGFHYEHRHERSGLPPLGSSLEGERFGGKAKYFVRDASGTRTELIGDRDRWPYWVLEILDREAEADRQRQHSRGYLLSKPVGDVPVVS